MNGNPPGTVYLIHFAEGIACRTGAYRPSTTQHYIGWADNVDRRMAQHANGSGGKLMAEVVRRGIPWVVARVWNDRDRTFERALKDRHMSRRYCPCCVGEKALRLREASWEELRVSLAAVHALTVPPHIVEVPGYGGMLRAVA